MIEVRVRRDELPARAQQLRYLAEFLGLAGSDIFEEPEGRDDVEAHLAERDGVLENVRFDQVRRRIVNGDVNAVIADVSRQQRPQGGRPAADVEQVAVPA